MKKELRLYNTETREHHLIPHESGKTIKMYTCGPTIYNFVHIGNLRTFVFEDLLRRSLLYFGYKLEHVMNLTDVDDKTIKGALENKLSLEEFVAPYAKAFFEDLETLHVQKAEHYPKATNYVPQMIEMIEKLLEKGFAYRGPDGCVYFSIKKFPKYGRLSHLQDQDLVAGASERIETDEYEKDHVADFVLWKSYDRQRDGDVFWESPFGKGRPGWHIECSAMATSILGETLDIHVGGIDNMFPHHDNEIAQSEAYYECDQWINYFLHTGHLHISGKKMSKSLKNFITIKHILTEYSARQVRFLFLLHSWDSLMNYTTEKSMPEAVEKERQFSEFFKTVKATLRQCNIKDTQQKSLQRDFDLNDVFTRVQTAVHERLADNFDTPEAVKALSDLVAATNSYLQQDRALIKVPLVRQISKYVFKILKVFGVYDEDVVPAGDDT